MPNKQIICPECGRIAEVRRQSNGQKLRYFVCKEKHGGLHTRKDAAKWEELEQDNLGVFGEFPALEAVEEFKPEPETEEATPVLDLQNDDEKSRVEVDNPESQDKDDEKPKRDISTLAIVGVTILGLFGIGGMAYAKSKRGK